MVRAHEATSAAGQLEVKRQLQTLTPDVCGDVPHMRFPCRLHR